MRRLRQLLQESAAPASPSMEHCELCREPLAASHRHLWDGRQRNVVCVCSACSLLMTREGSAGGKYRLIPQRYLALTHFVLTDSAWRDLLIPVNMAFLIQSTQPDRHVSAFYPGPAGAVESELDASQWQPVLQANPVLDTMELDVEALLINRIRAPYSYYLVPVDSCYQLVGLLRRSWHGFSGGEAVWQIIADYFEAIQVQSHVWNQPLTVKGSMHARS
ncbi:hypothetical protein KDA_59440 [Dictyobacter alpinus]|uniref:Uncharacterized protein n=1 Tax=Dictyobacter alpinus TaxID=2014873 RepID=A0A402BGR4_9CHLR|nr:DUF5947 family protein [Dictyobacter alpinus]GCE30460.1 hypothetical protein KDA_59440 [Dictyobacter alpinus]